MQKIILTALCTFVSIITTAQFTYKIKADSLKVTNDSCSAELILENSTKNINGFLYNKGNGRTEFRKGLVKLNDTVYVIGGDTLRVGAGVAGNTNGYIQNQNDTTQTANFSIYGNGYIRPSMTDYRYGLKIVPDGFNTYYVDEPFDGLLVDGADTDPYGLYTSTVANLFRVRAANGSEFKVLKNGIPTIHGYTNNKSVIADINIDASVDYYTDQDKDGLFIRGTGLANYGSYSTGKLRLLRVAGLAEGLTVTRDGNVGIGTLSPSAKLEIEPVDSVTTALRIKAATGQDSALIDVKNTLNNSIFTLENNKATLGSGAYDYTNGTNFKGLQINYTTPGNTEGLTLTDIGYGTSVLLRADAYGGLQVKNLSGGFATLITNAVGNPSDGTALSNGYGIWKLNSNLLVGSGSYPTSTFQIQGSFATGYESTASSLTLNATHSTMNVTASGQTITLPSAVDIAGRTYVIKLTASGSCTVATTSSQTIDGSSTYSLSAQWKYVTVQSDNANWIIIGNN